DFERLCSNSNFEKHQILTQALKEFMKKYKNLL
ncbi:TPA: DNA-binding protein, partial [Clostridioides difficile]|nr:DNA-binding protein [Clostridioides difficile]